MLMKRLLAIILTFLMLFSMVGVYANETDYDMLFEENVDIATETIEEIEDTVTLQSQSGVLESGISWSLTGAGMLTISGSGEMDDFSLTDTPWNDSKQYIRFIYVSEGITRIGNYAFADLTNVKSVFIPESVEAIGDSAFERCSGIKEFDLPDGLKTIGANAFKYCSAIKTITIPESVEEIGLNAFSSCRKLKEILVDDGNAEYASLDGVLFSADETVLVYYPDNKGDDEYEIPDGVLTIGSYAFDDCSDLTNVIFPDSLETIEDGAFYECDSIEIVEIPASVTYIAQSAFVYGCYSLEEINVDEDNSVYSSEYGVLFDKEKTKLIRFPAAGDEACYMGFYEMPKTVKTIGQEAFMDCENIETLSIHGNLAKIEMAAFMFFDSLVEIWFDGTSFNWEMVEKEAFNEKLDEVDILFMEASFDKVFNAKTGVTYYLDNFVDIEGNEEALATLVVSSSDTTVATVDREKMTAVSEGEAIITAIAYQDGLTYAAAVKVVVTDSGADSNEGTFTLEEEETMDLKSALSVPEEFMESLLWTSTNNKVATVENGVVTAVGAGNAVIIASVENGTSHKYSVRCEITVERKYTDESYFVANNGTITKYIGPDSEVIIPPEIGGYAVKAIGGYAFKDCTHVTKVELPLTVTSIGNYAFLNCSSLSNITLHEGITNLGGYAFSGCSALIKMKIPSTVNSSGYGWFTNCTRLNTVILADGTTNIHYGLRGGTFKNVTIPSTVTSIPYYAFDGCANLISIVIPGSVTSISGYAFRNCYKLREVLIENGVKTIGSDAFYNCTTLESVVIPDSVTSIGSYAFSFCTSLSNIELGNGVKQLGSRAFSGCTSLENITIPDSVTTIYDYAFSGCDSLTSIVIPDSVTYIGSYVFTGCENLTDVTIGGGIKTIGGSLFTGCKSIRNITLSEGVKIISYAAFSGCTGLESIVIPDSVETIGSSAFYNCRSLKSVTLGAKLRALPDSIFEGCSSLKEIELPEGITNIGMNAFRYCTALESIVIPDSVSYIFQNAFYNCTNLRSVDFGNGLTSVSSYAFYNTALTSIDIPDSVTVIGSYVFGNCKNLTNIEFGSGLKNIGGWAFSGCTALESVALPENLYILGSYIFKDCTNLKNVDFGNISLIESYMFYNCRSLDNVVIPESVKTIGYGAFYNCDGLRNVELGSNVKEIRTYAFYSCNLLERIALPESVNYVGDYAFAYCVNLSDVQIGNGLCYFGYDVFLGCNKLDNTNEWKASYKALSEEAVGYFPMQIEYDIRGNFLTEKKITVDLPQTTYLVSNSMKLDGEAYTNYVEEERANYYNRVIINLEKNSGVLTFFIKPTEYKSMSTTATLNYKRLGRTYEKRIGTVTLSMPEITISAVETTGKADVIVSGQAVPRKDVKLYVDGVYQKTVRSTSSGTYKTSVNISKPENYHEYVITAEVSNYGETYSADTLVKYVSDTPDLEQLSFHYGLIGRSKSEYVLYNSYTDVKSPIILWGDYYTRRTDGYDYYFSVDISQRETVDKVYVVSTRSGKKEYLEAKWNNKTKRYETSGYFTGKHSYMPGVLTVEYTKVNKGLEAELSDIMSYLDFDGDSFIPSVTDYTATSYSAEAAVSEALKDLFGTGINLNVETIERDYSAVSSEELYPDKLNYYSYPLNKDGNEYVIGIDVTDSYSVKVYLHDITNGKQTSFDISFTLTDSEGVETNLSVTEILSRSAEYEGKLPNAYNLDLDLDYITEGLNLSGLQPEEIDEGIKMAEELKIKKQVFILISAVLSATSVEGIPTPYEILGYILDIIAEDVEYFKDLRLLNIYRIGPECKVRWKIDPSGYVYEGVTNNRLEGVTATAYFVDHEDVPKKSDGTADVENINPEDIIEWDASEWDNQENPIITGVNGEYRWDVPEGYWLVKFEKEGYETAYSDWLPVLPAQTDVNMGLVSNAAPEVTEAYLTTEYLRLTFDKYMNPDTITNVTVGDAEYTVEYDDSETDVEGNVYAKEFMLRFKTALRPGTDYDITVSEAESYAGVAMKEYSSAKTTDGEPIPEELIISDVTVTAKTIKVEYTNNLRKPASFDVVCAVYDEKDRLLDTGYQTIYELGSGKTDFKEFTFDNLGTKYKIFTWSADGKMNPVIDTYDSSDNN